MKCHVWPAWSKSSLDALHVSVQSKVVINFVIITDDEVPHLGLVVHRLAEGGGQGGQHRPVSLLVVHGQDWRRPATGGRGRRRRRSGRRVTDLVVLLSLTLGTAAARDVFGLAGLV